MRDYFSPREGFWLRSRFGSTSSTFQFNLFHRKTWFGTGSSPSASPSFFFCCLSSLLLSTLPSALCFDVILCVTVVHPAAGTGTCERELNGTDFNLCLRSQSFSSRLKDEVASLLRLSIRTKSIIHRYFIHDMTSLWGWFVYEVCHTKLSLIYFS